MFLTVIFLRENEGILQSTVGLLFTSRFNCSAFRRADGRGGVRPECDILINLFLLTLESECWTFLTLKFWLSHVENSNFQPYNTLFSYSWRSSLKTQISDFIFVLQQDGWTFFLGGKNKWDRFLGVSCPFNWSLRIQSITVFPLTVLKSFRPKWFYSWAAGMLHWSDKDRL